MTFYAVYRCDECDNEATIDHRELANGVVEAPQPLCTCKFVAMRRVSEIQRLPWRSPIPDYYAH